MAIITIESPGMRRSIGHLEEYKSIEHPGKLQVQVNSVQIPLLSCTAIKWDDSYVTGFIPSSICHHVATITPEADSKR